jgi:DNA-binding transcriptional regulator/RsmH inhibitor MraZ
MEIAWEIATWSDVAPILEHKLGFKIPDDLRELTSQQASQIIQTLKELKKPLTNEQIKEAKELLEKLAQKQNLKPEDLAAKLNLPSSTSQLKLYHLELLKQLVMQEGETK